MKANHFLLAACIAMSLAFFACSDDKEESSSDNFSMACAKKINGVIAHCEEVYGIPKEQLKDERERCECIYDAAEDECRRNKEDGDYGFWGEGGPGTALSGKCPSGAKLTCSYTEEDFDGSEEYLTKLNIFIYDNWPGTDSECDHW